MKIRLTAILLLTVMLVLPGCGSFKVYALSDIIPPLMDVTTQYPFTEKITVTQCETGKTLEFTEGSDHDLIRMRLEGIQAVREKLSSSAEVYPTYEITFHTTEGSLTVTVLQNGYDFVIDGYRYEALRSGIDIVFFENLFLE